MADGSHQGAAHVIGLCADDMFEPDPPNSPACGFGPVAALGLLAHRLAPIALAVNVAFELAVAQLGLHLLGLAGFTAHTPAPVLPRVSNSSTA